MKTKTWKQIIKFECRSKVNIDFIVGRTERLGDVLSGEERVGYDPAADDHHQGTRQSHPRQRPILNNQPKTT